MKVQPSQKIQTIWTGSLNSGCNKTDTSVAADTGGTAGGNRAIVNGIGACTGRVNDETICQSIRITGTTVLKGE